MNYNPRHPMLGDSAITVDDRLGDLYASAGAFIAPGRIEGLMRQWLKFSGQPASDMGTAMLLATDLALNTPSMIGRTAFDRLARSGARHTPEDTAVLTALRRARFRIVQCGAGVWRDIVTNEVLPLRSDRLAAHTDGAPVFCLVVPMPEGLMREGPMPIAGLPIPLDEAAMAVTGPFIRPGARGLSNPVHCAELVYRHVVRHGVAWPAPRPGSGPRPTASPRPELGARQRSLPFDPANDPLDALAADWAERLGDLAEKDFLKARAHTRTTVLINLLSRTLVARDAGYPRLSDAYARIALVIIETIVLRHRHGFGGMNLEQLAAEVAAVVARHGLPSRMRDLFETLRERVKLAPAAGRSGDTDLDRLVQRIRGLRAKTVEQGCTEHEAMAAAGKVAELLDRYGLTLNELDLRRQACEGVGIETSRKRRGPIDSCMTAIARFFDCRVWSEISQTGTIRYIFFGLPADVPAAVYLHDLVAMAFESETVAFQAGSIYRDTPSGDRRTATNSFQIGLSLGIAGKLGSLRTARDSARQSSGRDLVPVKQSIIENDLEKLGLTFTKRGVAGPRRGLPDAFAAGQEAGERFDYRPGIEAASA